MRQLVIDTESDGLVDEATQFHCIVAKDISTKGRYEFYGDETVVGHHGSITCGVDYAFTPGDVLPIGHNLIGHDIPLVEKLTGRHWRGRVLDTLILSRACNADRRLPPGCPTKNVGCKGASGKVGPHSLQAWGYRVGRGKPEHHDWNTFSPDMLFRCQEDVEINHLVLNALLSEVGVNSIEELPDWVWVEMKVAELLVEQEKTGWLIDRNRLAHNIKILENLKQVLERKLQPNLPWIAKPAEGKETGGGAYKWVKNPFLKSGQWSKPVVNLFPEFQQFKPAHPDLVIRKRDGTTLNWSIGGPFCRVEFRQIRLTSDAEVKGYLMSLGWVPLEWNYSKKTKAVTSPKLTEESMDLSKDKVGKTGMQIMQHIKCCHRLGQMIGWLGAIDKDGRIHAYVNGQGCPTARMTHKVIVNVPSPEKKSFYAKKMREVFVAEEGYTLVGTDSVSCQVRMLCHYMGDDEFTNVVLNGKKEDGTDIHSFNKDKAGLPTRGHAKNFFYGFIFGAGAAKVGKLVNKDAKAGKKIINDYLEGLPKLKALKEGLLSKYKQRGYLIGLDGRKLYPRSDKDCLVTLLQGGEAILMKWAMVYVNHWIRQEGLDARQVNIMHDEYTFEVKLGQEARVKGLTRYAIQKAGEDLGLTVPADGDPASGRSWKDIH